MTAQQSLFPDGHEDCPFCDGHDLTTMTVWKGKYHCVKCKTCKTCGPLALSEEEAWSLWDKRPSYDR